MSSPQVHPVQIYYEGTDHSGVVYHSNQLKYFGRGRPLVPPSTC
jgi:acyl-CoA thioesterase FadM